MLTKVDLINNMKSHFSRWMDIRKRTSNSNGGKLLEAQAKEIENINKALEDYRKDFFISNYFDKTEEIPYLLKRCLIGDVDIKNISLKDKEISLSKKDFYLKDNLAYFEDGYLYFKTDEVDDYIEYKHKGYLMKEKLDYHHVWNIYDEFACFLGLNRYELEDNEDLLNRILNHSYNRPNSHEEGLKNTIINSLINEDVDLTYEDIKIKKITPENLLEYKEEFENIIEKIIFKNKDVIRAKRWDVDIWSFGSAKIDYIPHMWDVLIDYYKDGVGYNNSLKASLSNYPSIANINLAFYKKTDKLIAKWVENKKLKHNINLKLTKYKDQIHAIPVDFNVEAYNVLDISKNNIEIESYNYKEDIYEENIINLLGSSIPEDVEQKININARENDKVTFVFKAQKEKTPMLIKDFSLVKDNKDVELLDKIKLKHPFNKKDGVIYNTKTSLYADSLKDFLEVENFKENINDKSLDMIDINKEAKLSLDISDIEEKYLYVDYEVEAANVTDDMISLYNFEKLKGGEYKVSKKYGELTLDIMANYISFDLEGYAEISINNADPIIYNGSFSTEESPNPKRYTIRIMDFNDDLIVKNIKYKNYNFNKTLEKGEIRTIKNTDILPDEKNNKLYLSFKTNNGKYISFKNVYIGLETIDDSLFYSFDWEDNIQNVKIDTNCKVDLYKNDKLIEEDFKPTVALKTKEEDSLLKLNLKNYKEFEILNDNVKVKLIEDEYYLLLNKNEFISKLIIKGKKISKFNKEKLNDLINFNPNEERLFLTNAMEGLIIKDKHNIDRFIKLTKALINNQRQVTDIKNIPDTIVVKYVLDEKLDIIEENNKTDKNFNYVSFKLKDSNKHIALNSRTILSKKDNRFEIIHNFLPSLKENVEMFYLLQEHKPLEHKVSFVGNNSKWSVNKKEVNIESLTDFNEKDNYYKEVSFVNKDFILSKEIKLDRFINEIDLTTGILEIEESGHDIIYKEKKVSENYDSAPEFYQHDLIKPNKSNITKLKHSQIDDIIYIGYSKWNGKNDHSWEIEEDSIDLLKEEGIIIWNKNPLKEVNIVYTIKIPFMIKIKEELIYDKVSMPIEALEKIDEKQRTMEIYEDTVVPINSLTNKKYDIIKIDIDNINIGYSIVNNNIIFSSKGVDPRSITINPGYYYIDGKEYYLYNKEKKLTDDNEKNIIKNNVEQKDGYLIFKKESYNFIENSKFSLTDEDTIYYADFENDKKIESVSDLGVITSCDDYNLWNKVNINASLTKGLNGYGMKLEPLDRKGYIYMDISKYVNKNKKLSFYSDPAIKGYIGVGLKDNNNSPSPYIDKLIEIEKEEKYNYFDFKDIDEDYKYYIVISGRGMFDDLLISNKISKKDHTPMIDKLNIIKSKDIIKDEEVLTNLFNKSKHNQTENEENLIRLSSSIKWDYTDIRTFNSKEDWDNLKYRNVDIKNNMIFTHYKNGKIELPKIELEDKRIIKEIVVKINDININDYNGFRVNCFTGNRFDETHELIDSKIGNLVSFKGQDIKKYINISVDIPSNTIIDNLVIYIRYKEDYAKKPKVVNYKNGSCLTRVFRTNQEGNYKLHKINFKKLVGAKYFNIYIRGARLNDRGNYIWTNWKEVKFSKKEILNEITFSNYGLFQFNFVLNDKSVIADIESIILKRF